VGIKGIRIQFKVDQATGFHFYAAAPRMPRQLCCGVRRRSFDSSAFNLQKLVHANRHIIKLDWMLAERLRRMVGFRV